MKTILIGLIALSLVGCRSEQEAACYKQHPDVARDYQICMDICFKFDKTDDFKRCEDKHKRQQDEEDSADAAVIVASSVAAATAVQ